MWQYYHVVWQASNRQFIAFQLDWAYRRNLIFLCAATIVIGQGYKAAVLIDNAENITLIERLAENLVTAYLTPLVEQSVGGLRTAGMGVNKDQPVALAYNLCMLFRDAHIINHNIVAGIASDIDDLLIERIGLLAAISIAAYFQCRDTHLRERGDGGLFWTLINEAGEISCRWIGGRCKGIGD